MSGELCNVHLEECCDVRVVTVLRDGLWRKKYRFPQSDCSMDFQMKIHIAHFFPEMTCSSRSSRDCKSLEHILLYHGNQQFRNLIKRLHLNCVA